MKTDLIRELLEREGRDLEQAWVKGIPLGRMAHPSELRGTVVWMASEAASYLNGSDIVSINQFPLELFLFKLRVDCVTDDMMVAGR